MADLTTKTIGELPAIASLSDSTLIPAEQGGEAGSISVGTFKEYAEIITVTLPSFSSLGSWTAQGINSSHVLIDCVLSDPSAQTSDWTVVTGSNSITISGSINGSTTATLRFGLQGSSINATAN